MTMEVGAGSRWGQAGSAGLYLCEGSTDKSTAERGPRRIGSMSRIKGTEREPPIQADLRLQQGAV